MRVTVVALCCVLFASQAFGQQATQTRKGRSKAIWTGAGLLGAGLVVMPVTGLAPAGRYNVPLIGVGLVAAGGSLIYWGVRNQQKPPQPNTTIGVMLRRSAGLQVRRSW